MSRRRPDGTWAVSTSPLTPELAVFIRDSRAGGKTYRQICAGARKAGFTLSLPDISRHLEKDTKVEIDGVETSFRELFRSGQELYTLLKADEIDGIEAELHKTVRATNGGNWPVNRVKIQGLSKLAGLKHRHLDRHQPKHLKLEHSGNASVLVVPESELFEGESDE